MRTFWEKIFLGEKKSFLRKKNIFWPKHHFWPKKIFFGQILNRPKKNINHKNPIFSRTIWRLFPTVIIIEFLGLDFERNLQQLNDTETILGSSQQRVEELSELKTVLQAKINELLERLDNTQSKNDDLLRQNSKLSGDLAQKTNEMATLSKTVGQLERRRFLGRTHFCTTNL